jgi:hypothetical protein
VADDFISMVQDIATDLNRGASHHTRIKKAIVDAIRFYRAFRFGFNQKRAQTTLNPNLEFIVLPVNWLEVDTLKIEEDGYTVPMREKTFDWIDENFRGRTDTGRPVYFALQNRQLRFAPVPDTSYSLVMSFLYQLPEISYSSSDAATNAWMTEGEELIRKHALGDLKVTYIGTPAEVQLGMALRQECRELIAPQLEAQAARETTAGKLQGWL